MCHINDANYVHGHLIKHMHLCLIFRALMTHASVSPEEREKLGISDTLVCSYINGNIYGSCMSLNDVVMSFKNILYTTFLCIS